MVAPIYEDSLRVLAARARYFDAWGFDERSYTSSWVALKQVGPFSLGFPNTAARKRAVKLHDLHHVATGYSADWIGEGEIGAWEVGASCHRHWAAWVLNLGAMGYGTLLAPRRILHAMARGRRSETLYRAYQLDESLLELTVGELRQRLKMAGEVEPAFRDLLALMGWLVVAGVIRLGPGILALALSMQLLR